MFKDAATQRLYNERMKRYVTAMHRGVPDRVPLRFFFQEVAARHCGYTNQQVGVDYNLAFEATRRMAVDVNADAVMLNAIWSNYGVGKAFGHRYLKVPGVDVGIDSVLQYAEPEGEHDAYMRADEYDEVADDPTAFLLTKWLPRASAKLSSDAVTLSHNAALLSGGMAYANYMNAFGPASAALMQSGVVSANAGMVKAPFDILADKFRGYVNLLYDCVERPRDVLRVCEALTPHLIANALAGADPSRNVPVTLWAHRGCLPYINREIFDNIMWPTLKPVLEAIIAAGHQVLFYGEGDWSAHYDDLLTLPENGIIFHIDRDDLRAARRLQQKFALSGGVRYDALCRGERADIERHVQTLLDTLARDGAYICDASALMLHDVNPANVKIVADYVLEHGAYSTGHSGAHFGDGADKLPVVYGRPTFDGERPPYTVTPWECESAHYAQLCGDVDMVRNAWQSVDGLAYDFAWTTLLW